MKAARAATTLKDADIRSRIEAYANQAADLSPRDDAFGHVIRRLLRSDGLSPIHAIGVIVERGLEHHRLLQEEDALAPPTAEWLINGVVEICAVAERRRRRFPELIKRARAFNSGKLIHAIGLLREFLSTASARDADLVASVHPLMLSIESDVEATDRSFDFIWTLLANEALAANRAKSFQKALRKSGAPEASKLAAMAFISEVTEELAGSKRWDQALALVNAVLDDSADQTTMDQLQNASGLAAAVLSQLIERSWLPAYPLIKKV